MRIPEKICCIILLFTGVVSLVFGQSKPFLQISDYNVVWNVPSQNSSGSMPLGNGDIGLNVWVNESGEVLFYLSKTDAWDENAQLLKLGRIRMSLSPNPIHPGDQFRQELDLASGSIRIQLASEGPSVVIWVDANQPVVRLEINSEQPVSACMAFELWRNSDDVERVNPDTVVTVPGNAVAWCHRNRTSCWTSTLEHQDMSAWIPQGCDPLMNRTFGALLRGNGLIKSGESQLHTAAPQSHITASIHALTAQTATVEDWTTTLTQQAARSDEVDLKTAFAEHCQWWRAFWERSWISVSGTPQANIVSRGYILQRFMNACSGRGAYPIKFNGSIFTVDAREDNETHNADYRRWGGGYWFQNTRLIYWPMIAAGDFDLMEPWFRMYRDDLPLAAARAKLCFGFDNAAVFPETLTFWGTFLNSNYGKNRGNLKPGLSQNTYIRRYWQGQLELLAVLLDAYAVSGDKHLLKDYLLILAPPFLRFYHDYYSQRDENGKMLFKPSQSLETWHDAINPAPDIAGLQWVIDGLLSLPDSDVPDELRNEWRAFRDILPPLPTRSYYWEKRKIVIPALQYDDCRNLENPALYTVFPYRIFGVGKPEIEVGIATWKARLNKETGCWRQDAIQAALLGLTDEAKSAVVTNFSTSHNGSRFPAFWGPNFDWIPDLDHGGVSSMALQYMLMQCDKDAICLLPAWPKDWDVDFKLHAPSKTIVEGRVQDGIIRYLKVTPPERRKNIHLGEGWEIKQ